MHGLMSKYYTLGLVFVLLSMLPSDAVADEQYSFENVVMRLNSGDVDTLQIMLKTVSSDSPLSFILKGLFESDADKARFLYDRIMAYHSESEFEALALERIWLYHYTKGEITSAERFYGFLENRHPEYASARWKPDFKARDELSTLRVKNRPVESARVVSSTKRNLWTIQVGAFSDEKRANAVAKQVFAYGEVHLVKRSTSSGNLTAVQVGRFESRQEAEKVSETIDKRARIKGKVLKLENN